MHQGGRSESSRRFGTHVGSQKQKGEIR